jgi:hypothetical protein
MVAFSWLVWVWSSSGFFRAYVVFMDGQLLRSLVYGAAFIGFSVFQSSNGFSGLTFMWLGWLQGLGAQCLFSGFPLFTRGLEGLRALSIGSF